MTIDLPRSPGFADSISRQRLLVWVRWFAVVFGLVQVLAYDFAEYPPGIRNAALLTVGILAAGNVGLAVGLHRIDTRAAAVRIALVSLVLDGLVASAFAFLYSFDPVSALFALLFLVPIEGAVHFQLRGALLSWAAVSVLYTGREIFAVRYDNPFELTSLTFRVGLIGLVALAVGLITQQLAREHEISRSALAELRRVELWRARLVAMLGHDVRTPLAAVNGLATTLAAHAQTLSPEEVRDFSQRIVRQSDRLTALSDDLLDLARQEEDHLTLRYATVALADLVAAAAETAGHSGDTRIDIPPSLTVDVDPGRFEQVLTNLVINAHRHGRPPVEIAAALHSDRAVLTVRDHGDGVPIEIEPHLFDPFVRGHGDRAIGLGLWIVRLLVSAHGGEVEYAKADPGSCFTIALPLQPPVNVAQGVAPELSSDR